MNNELKIYEFKGDNPYGLYIAGVDKYKIPNSVSLGEVHIYPKNKNRSKNDKIIATYRSTLNK